ncbi:MAG TPA: Hsp20/alpha crystallin family protein [Candidatus Obscuribacterales bacterium]
MEKAIPFPIETPARNTVLSFLVGAGLAGGACFQGSFAAEQITENAQSAKPVQCTRVCESAQVAKATQCTRICTNARHFDAPCPLKVLRDQADQVPVLVPITFEMIWIPGQQAKVDRRIADADKTPAANADTTRIVHADSKRVADADRTRIANADKTGVANADSKRVANADKTGVANADSKRVANADKTRIPNAEKTRVADADKTRIPNAEKTRVTNADKTRIPNADNVREESKFDEQQIDRWPFFNLSYVPEIKTEQTKQAMKIEANMKDINQANLEVVIDRNVLTIRGSLNEQKRLNKEGKVTIAENFERDFALPWQADVDKVDAVLQNDVLTITVPKCQHHQVTTKRIAIKRV